MLTRLAIALYGLTVATLFWLLCRFLHLCVRVRHVNTPSDLTQHTVDCAWHDTLMPYFIGAMPYRWPDVWMNHPACRSVWSS